jgi:hypothetical protein
VPHAQCGGGGLRRAVPVADLCRLSEPGKLQKFAIPHAAQPFKTPVARKSEEEARQISALAAEAGEVRPCDHQPCIGVHPAASACAVPVTSCPCERAMTRSKRAAHPAAEARILSRPGRIAAHGLSSENCPVSDLSSWPKNLGGGAAGAGGSAPKQQLPSQCKGGATRLATPADSMPLRPKPARRPADRYRPCRIKSG